MTTPRPSDLHDVHLREPEVVKITETCVHLSGNFSLKRLEAIVQVLKAQQKLVS